MKKITIACLGDTMPGGILHYEKGDNFCSGEILDRLKKADIRVATLETAIGDKPLFDKEKMKREKDVIYCPTSDLQRLATLGINVVSFANNHAWDLGLDGIHKAKSELDRLGIKYCGAGDNLEEASKPAVIECNGKKIAFIAYCDNKPGTCGYIPVATDSTPGINTMIEANIMENIAKLRPLYDYVYVLMHWGKEYYYYPTPEVNKLSRKIIDWGADGVIGSHSHQIQPVVSYKGKPIIFSLGNFFFPDRIINSPRSTFYPDNSVEIKNMPVTCGYPFVKEPTFKKWKAVARMGQVVIINNADKSVEHEIFFTQIDASSHLDIFKDTPPMFYYISRSLVKLPFYKTIFTFLRGCRGVRKILKNEI